MKFDIDNSNLFEAYNQFLNSSFLKPFWDGGSYTNQRISWKLAKEAKNDVESFHSPGIYIWGFEKTPLYIGKAERQSLSSRFSRYIFSSKSQCKVAEKYTKHLNNGGNMKTRDELRNEHNISGARAKGAKAFGEVGAQNIWFILIPLEEKLISDFENELIEVGFEWNNKKGYKNLINAVRPNK
ncbi:hypothetical protein MWU50_07370 [Flavobacteriaceae bacterium S0862]|nr:hypothetical protein [Flavobacteriaceae bacterium S0862]